MKVLICDPIDAKAVAMMREAGIVVDVRDDITPQELEQVIGEYAVLVVRSRTTVPAALIDQAPHLKLIVRGGVGLDNIDAGQALSLIHI